MRFIQYETSLHRRHVIKCQRYILLQKVKTNQLLQCASTKLRPSCGICRIWHFQSVYRIAGEGGGDPYIKNEGACQKF